MKFVLISEEDLEQVYAEQYPDMIEFVPFGGDDDYNEVCLIEFKDEKEFLNASLRCLSVITNDNAHNAKDCVNSGLITKLKNEVSQLNQVDNEDIIINLT